MGSIPSGRTMTEKHKDYKPVGEDGVHLIEGNGQHVYPVSQEFYDQVVAALDASGSFRANYSNVAEQNGWPNLLVRLISERETRMRRTQEELKKTKK